MFEISGNHFQVSQDTQITCLYKKNFGTEMCIKFETEEISITGLAARVIRKTKIEEKVRSFALRVSLFQAPR